MKAQVTLITAKSLDKGPVLPDVISLEQVADRLVEEFVKAKRNGVLEFEQESGSWLVVSSDTVTGFLVKEV